MQHETPGRSVRSGHTCHLRLHPGRIQEARDEALGAARRPLQLHRQHREHVVGARQARNLLALPHSEITEQFKLHYFIQCDDYCRIN